MPRKILSPTTLGRPRIGVIAPSSVTPAVELKLGVARLKEAGFQVSVHPQCKKKNLFFAGTDEERASAFFEYARDPSIDLLWCARGGYGAVRLLPILDRLSRERGMPARKLLMGSSDATSLLEYVRQRWGWATLHSPMPGLRKFGLIGGADWESMLAWAQGNVAPAPWGKTRLKFWSTPPRSEIRGRMVGGNLVVWSHLMATPYEARAEGCLFFLEDVDEAHYRIDRVLQQMRMAGQFEGVRAIVLGDFLNCRDYAPSVLKVAPSPKKLARALREPSPRDLVPARKVMDPLGGLKEIFGELGDVLNIPVAFGLPVGHGPGVSSLPLGAEYRLSPEGRLEMVYWDWLKRGDGGAAFV